MTTFALICAAVALFSFGVLLGAWAITRIDEGELRQLRSELEGARAALTRDNMLARQQEETIVRLQRDLKHARAQRRIMGRA